MKIQAVKGIGLYRIKYKIRLIAQISEVLFESNISSKLRTKCGRYYKNLRENLFQFGNIYFVLVCVRYTI